MSIRTRALLVGALASIPAAAFGQTVGTTIYGADGRPLGTVAEADARVVVIDTGTTRAPVPLNLVFDGARGKTFNATRDQLDAMMAERLAAAARRRDAALVAGAPVISLGGSAVGTLAAVDLARDAIILAGPAGPLKLRKEHFAVTPQGRLAVLFNHAQITGADTPGGPAARGSGGAR